MDSPKNKLQEYYQKLGLSNPVYNTVRVGGEDHVPVFTSVVTLEDGTKIPGVEASNKKMAEMSAAEEALKSLVSKLDTKVRTKKVTAGGEFIPRPSFTKVRLSPSSKIGVFIDGENLPNFATELVERIEEELQEDLDIFYFIGEHHHNLEKVLPDRVKRIISASSRPDGTDTCIQLHVGVALVNETYDHYIIATRDHFGGSLVDMITAEGYPWKPQKAMMVSTVSQIANL
jgi:hypothetical protein